MKNGIVLIFAAVAFGCNGTAEPETSDSPTIPSTVDTAHAQEDVSFEDVLAQYQALNQRLEDVSYQLQSSNAALCPVTDRATGITVHTIYDYPDNLQPYARSLLSVDEGLSLRTVRPGSTADVAGLMPADHLVQIGGTYLPSGRTAKTLYEALAKRVYLQDELEIKIRRGEAVSSHSVKPETICGYPVNLFFSERINGHTDGKEVWITSEMMRALPNDEDLALVIAHEMAHAIAGHVDMHPTKALELEADKMALIMLARAGFNTEQAVTNWAYAPHPDDDAHPSMTHPTQAERLAHFDDVQTDILARQKIGKPINFGD